MIAPDPDDTRLMFDPPKYLAARDFPTAIEVQS